MGHIYRIWFQWGFISFAIALTFGLVMRCSESGLKAFGVFGHVLIGCFGVSICLNYLALIALGLMWRFSESGRVVSGDRLIKSKEMMLDEALWKQ